MNILCSVSEGLPKIGKPHVMTSFIAHVANAGHRENIIQSPERRVGLTCW